MHCVAEIPSRWDTQGQEAFAELRTTYCYPGTDVLLMCFRHDRLDSFENIEEIWLEEWRRDDNLKKAPVGSKIQINDNVLLCVDILQVLLVGLQADLIDDEATKEKLAKEGKVRLNPSPQTNICCAS